MARAVTDQRSPGIVGTFVAAHRVAFNRLMAMPMPPALPCVHESMAIAGRRGGTGGVPAPRSAR